MHGLYWAQIDNCYNVLSDFKRRIDDEVKTTSVLLGMKRDDSLLSSDTVLDREFVDYLVGEVFRRIIGDVQDVVGLEDHLRKIKDIEGGLRALIITCKVSLDVFKDMEEFNKVRYRMVLNDAHALLEKSQKLRGLLVDIICVQSVDPKNGY
jgi:hypothetical protein